MKLSNFSYRLDIHQPGRMYLAGGAVLVHKGIRSGQTLDINLQVTVDPANLVGEIARLKQRLDINIEFASPGDFMPLPAQWEARSEFVKRYGQVDVFYFDWYSLVLSKIQRSSRQDLIDIQLLVSQGFVETIELELFYQEVLNKIGEPPVVGRFPNLSRQQFSSHYQAIQYFLPKNP